MQISIEELVEVITRQVISELVKRGITVDYNTKMNSFSGNLKRTNIEIDMSNYKTPLLTENNVLSLSSDITEIIIPGRTIITPGAKDVIRKKKLNITYKNKSY